LKTIALSTSKINYIDPRLTGTGSSEDTICNFFVDDTFAAALKPKVSSDIPQSTNSLVYISNEILIPCLSERSGLV
tara:strand:+ start:3109 stop:3336 length:228 start_codon:yes stop_codon:yes gene_type:complete